MLERNISNSNTTMMKSSEPQSRSDMGDHFKQENSN